MDGHTLDLSLDGPELTARLVDFPSVSGQEKDLADAVEAALRTLPHLTVDRHGNNVVARTRLGRSERVVLAGHIDTVPIADNVPSRLDDDGVLWGCGTSDMKSGVAVQLRIAATVPEPNRDLTFVFYDNEEVAAQHNGLGHVAEAHPDWLEADFAVLLEPSDAQVEGGCQGTVRVNLRLEGERAHSARSWMGSNAIHAAPVLARLAAYEPRRPVIDGLEYREGLNAVGIEGGVATNVIPDSCTVVVNYRYAPDRSPEEAEAHVREVFADCGVVGFTVDDHSGAAMPGLSHPAAKAFMEAVGGTAQPKFGWTDVSRFGALGVPAVNYGPGDALFAHKRDEHVAVDRITHCEERLRSWLTS
ncbi:succinyl-diaminopimelate desuccinylase [Streptomyces sp. SL203]|nr:succinyl-diaminopimelate desuccinylase [Streptomyces sp. SL203]MCY1653489.1 succinyl-diaminopimelate desuccinylase [Streptomyces sp. SL203]